MTHPTALVRVACCQLTPAIGCSAYNRVLTENAIRSAAAQGAQLVVLPELVQSGYAFHDRDEALQVAEPQSGATLAHWARLAQELQLIIVGGFCEKLSDTQVANSAALLDMQGLRAVYRKAHLWDRETLIFEPGVDAPPVIDTVLGRLSMMICYDLEFPEWVRLPALQGVDLLCAPVNWPLAPCPPTEHPAEVTRVQANASVNRMFIAACDRSGTERGIDWIGGSLITDANGYRQTPALDGTQSQTIFAKIDLSEARNKRISTHNDVHRDRRPALYGPLLSHTPNLST
jgi:predicted amidohydrolase